MGWSAEKRRQRIVQREVQNLEELLDLGDSEEDQKFRRNVLTPILKNVQERQNHAKSTGLPFRPLTRNELYGGEENLWRVLFKIDSSDFYLGFNFYLDSRYEKKRLFASEIPAQAPSGPSAFGINNWPDQNQSQREIKKALYDHANSQIRGALGLEEQATFSDFKLEQQTNIHLNDLGLEIIWDPPLPALAEETENESTSERLETNNIPVEKRELLEEMIQNRLDYLTSAKKLHAELLKTLDMATSKNIANQNDPKIQAIRVQAEDTEKKIENLENKLNSLIARLEGFS